MSRKPLVILSQDEFFSQWEKEIKEAEDRIEEEKTFLKKRLSDALDKYLTPVWNKGRDELISRGLITLADIEEPCNEKSRSCEKDGCARKKLNVRDGVLYLVEDEGKNFFETLFNI